MAQGMSMAARTAERPLAGVDDERDAEPEGELAEHGDDREEDREQDRVEEVAVLHEIDVVLRADDLAGPRCRGARS